MKRLLILFANLLFLFSVVAAQGNGKRAQMRERMYDDKVAFIKERVGFTADEEKAFWPVYKEYMEQRRAVKQELKQIRNAIKKGDKVNYEHYNDLVVRIEVDEADLSKKYYEKMKAILPAEKIYKLHMAEREFKKQLLERVHQSCK